MWPRNAYYTIKPFLPRAVRVALKRWRAASLKQRHAAVWPVNPAAATPPPGWTGWPDGKRFALVLTHDVEGTRGLEQCRQLMDLELELGFRSSFNFIPEGEYTTPKDLRETLTAQGFEIGVHDFKHDGKLYWSRKLFASHARAINQYLHEWGAVGFRSGFMLRNLDWLHDLNVLYDSSCFDTDPFEPQPDGVGTIFPFWVSGGEKGGYAELPYTLPQDSTLFVIFEEKNIDTWKRKLDWIAAHGGMALLDVHPDYLNFSGGRIAHTFPADFYRQFLEYVRKQYHNCYWNALPREMAQLTMERARDSVAVLSTPGQSEKQKTNKPGRQKKIWIDLDNTPHVPLFEPIAEELSRRGYKVLLTARDAFQVCELADQKGLRYKKVGRHYGKNKLAKVLGLFYRALQLAPFALREKPDLALSHGARSQIILCNLLRIPTVLMADYEFAKYPPMMRPTWEMVPEVIPDSSLCCDPQHIRKYPGIKEDVYVSRMRIDPNFLHGLGLGSREFLIVTVRPPATEAHYHNPEAEGLFVRFMERAYADKGVRVVLLPRNARQAQTIRTHWPHWFSEAKTLIPSGAVDGLNLLWHSDLVVSGGGTMNREAAALGVPVYSIFRGKTGAIDLHLQKEGRLIMIQTLEQVDTRIKLSRRTRPSELTNAPSRALATVADHIEQIAAHA